MDRPSPTAIAHPAEPTERPAAWRRSASIATACAAAGCVALTALAGEIIPPLVVFAVAFGGLSVALRRAAGRWPLYAVLAVAVVFFAGSGQFIVEDLSHPDTIAGFGPQVVLTLSVLVAVVSAVLARSGSAAAPRPFGLVALAIGAVAIVGSAVATASLSDDDPVDGDVEVVARSAEYPAELHARAGTVGFYVANADPIRHTFVIEGTDVDQELPGSTSRRVEADLAPGTYHFYCSVPGHESMTGTLIVES